MNQKSKIIIPVLALACVFTFALQLPSQENADCLVCHSNPEFTAEKNGKTVSLYVSGTKLFQSVHGKMECVHCHADLSGKDFPHAEIPGKVDCSHCHLDQQKQFIDSLHGQALSKGDRLAPRCQNCHGSHDIIPVSDPKSVVAPIRIPFVCGSCHREGAPVQKQRSIHQANIIENYSESIHGEGLLKKGLSVTATCTSCHTSHHILPHTDPRSTINRFNITRVCTKCHAEIETVHRKVINGKLWQEKPQMIPACVECHQPHKARKIFYDQGTSDKDCLTCHGRSGLRAKDGRSMTVDHEEKKHSAHDKTACAQCHTGVIMSRNRPCETVIKKVDCAVCHSAQSEQYLTSSHGKLFTKGDPNAPTCTECHGKHRIMNKKESQSPIYPINVPSLCARCHQEGKKAAMRYQGSEHQIPQHYNESIHGKGLLKSGLVVTAMCTSCHTAHGELPARDPASSVNSKNIALTCSQCHFGVYEQFTRSVHSPLVTKTNKELPSCNTCHTAHTIKRTDQTGFKLEVMGRCGKCHLEVANTYFETYHGKVSQLGYGKTAKCNDCHGSHDVLSNNDPRSHLSRQNIVKTCQKCHPSANRRFAGYLTHATHHDPHKYFLVFITFWGMTFLLIGTFVASGLHTLLWLPRTIQMRRKHPPKPDDPNQKYFVRFTRLNRGLHATMMVSFITLALTGMTLKFSYTGWAAALSHALGGFESAGTIHRFAALVLFAVFFTHLWDLVRRKRIEYGSWKNMLFGPDTMLFTKRDLKEFIATIKWYIGMGPQPSFGRWTYWEKFDYFAVFWGVAIIGSSGLMLWFPEIFTLVLPGWLINIASIVHSDEALLAAGFIFTIHFFNTHLRPDKFPMDMVIFTGRVPLEDFKRERPQEYEELVKNGKLDAHLAPPFPPDMLKIVRVLAWTALTIGVSLVCGIIYALLFAYK